MEVQTSEVVVTLQTLQCPEMYGNTAWRKNAILLR